MRASRAYAVSVGTSGVLLAFAVLLLAVVGALLAFRAWPGDGVLGDAEGVTLDGATPLIEAEPLRLTATVAPELQAVRAAGRSAAGGGETDALGVAGVDLSGGSGGPAQDAGGFGGSPGSPAGSDRSPAGSSGSPAGSDGASAGSEGSPPGAGGGSDGVAGTVETVTHGGGQGLGQTAAPLGQLVEDTGKAVSKPVSDLGVKPKVIPPPAR
jgi:hypothetical protein